MATPAEAAGPSKGKKAAALLAGVLLLLFDALCQWLREALLGRTPPKSEFLKGNFGPIYDELYAEDLPVVGAIPADLEGQYVRNGPNPRWKPRGQLHWFDGDGMLHAVLFKEGRATYSNRYVRTQRFLEEEAAEEALHFKIGDWSNPLGKLRSFAAISLQKAGFSKLKGRSTANTALAYHGRRFLALCESDAPHQVLAPSLETVGQFTFGGALATPFTAHPKVDACTGEMFGFGYGFEKPPYLVYFVVGAEGEVEYQAPVTLEVPVMMHDFAVTENFAVFMDLPLTFRPERLLSRSEGVIMFEHSRPSRFGVLPRRPHPSTPLDQQIQWFQDEACYVFHTANAWEEGEEVVLVGCRSERVTSSLFSAQNTADDGYSAAERPLLTMWRFHRTTGAVERRTLSDTSVEFPVVHPRLLGRKSRYCYCACLDYEPAEPLLNGVVKMDMEKGEVGRITFGEKCYAGEAVFVPRSEEEDDGYLVTFVHNEATDKSELWVMDAQTMAAEPIARVKIPRRVPYGFHGKWLSAADIADQVTH